MPIWRGPLIVSVWPGWRMCASAVASVARARYHGSSTSSVPPGTGRGAAYGGGRWAAAPAGAPIGEAARGVWPQRTACSSSSSRGVSAAFDQIAY